MGLFVKSKPGDQGKGPGAAPPTASWAAKVSPGATPPTGQRAYLSSSGPRRGQGTVTAASSSGAIDPEFDAELQQILGAVPAPKGMDVFLTTLTTLGQYIPDEGNRFKAAADATKNFGLTPGQIADSLQAQLATLRQRHDEFVAELTQEAEESVRERESKLKDLSAQITDLQKQISKLQETAQQLTDDQRQLQNENAQVASETAQVTARFQSAFDSHTGRIQDLLNKVYQHLGQ